MADDVLTLADQFRRALVANDVAAEKRLIAAYQGLYARVRDLADALALEIAKDENMTPAQVRRLERYGRLLKTIEGELTDYGAFVKTEMSVAAREAIRMGEANARALVAIAFGDKRLAARFNVLNTAVIEQLLGFLSPEGELYKRLGMLPAYTADQVANAILEGVGLGKNPRTIAREIHNKLGMGLTDSMRMMRTVQIYSYREANLSSYRANSDVVKGWIWYANLVSACPACIAMHGTVHDLSERLNDHHCGKCAPLPLVIGAKNNITPGEDWFTKQPEAYQRQLLGKSKFEAWKDGKFKFGDLVTTHTDKVYGEMRTTKSLKDLLGTRAAIQGQSVRFAFQEAKSIQEADNYARNILGLNFSNYKGLDVRVANEWNRGLTDAFNRFPELKNVINSTGTTQGRYKAQYEYYYQKFLGDRKELYDKLGYSEQRRIEDASRLAKKYAGKTPANTYAYSTPPRSKLGYDGIFINNKYKYDDLIKHLADDIGVGFHPVGTGTVKSIVDHELGHKIDELYSISSSPDFIKYYSSFKPSQIEAGLSVYGAKNRSEFLAEAWSEYSNNPNPRPIAKYIGEMIIRIAKGV